MSFSALDIQTTIVCVPEWRLFRAVLDVSASCHIMWFLLSHRREVGCDPLYFKLAILGYQKVPMMQRALREHARRSLVVFSCCGRTRNNDRTRNNTRQYTAVELFLVSRSFVLACHACPFRSLYFKNALTNRAVFVEWSKRMTLCAGLCSYKGSSAECRIALSEPLLKFRSSTEVCASECLCLRACFAYVRMCFCGDSVLERR